MNKKDWWHLLYDKEYIKIYSSFFSPEETSREIDYFINTAPLIKSQRILDLCCGEGRHTIELAKRGYQVTGFDYSNAFLAKAKKDAQKEGVKINFVQGDIRQLPFEKEFDVVLMSGSAAFYFEDAENKNIFIELNKILKPGGKILLITSSVEKFFKNYKLKGKKIDKDTYKLQETTQLEDQTFELLKTINFKTKIEEYQIRILSSKGKETTRYAYFHHYTSTEIKEIFLKSGFVLQKTIEDFFNKPPERIIFIAQKLKAVGCNRMIEPRIITEIEKVREKRWRIAPFNQMPFLIAEAKSANPYSKEKALSMLDKTWLVKKENSIEKAEKVDILKEFEQFSSRQRKLILKCLYALELIKGCTGDCYYCLFDRKKRIEKKYSFQSLKKFYKKYSRYIPKRNDYLERVREKLLSKFPKYYKYLPLDLPKDKRITIYWDGDPFCYQDGDYTLIDVYKMMVNHGKGKFCRWISTSIPPGTQRNFVGFFEKIAEEYCHRTINVPLVRISIAKHNIQRVETTLKFLYQYLMSLGLNQEKVIKFFDETFIFHIRDEGTLEKVGPLFNKGDRFRDVISPQCKDGVVLCPDSSKVQMMVAANRFFPAGVLKISLKKNSLERGLVVSDSLMNYAYYLYHSDVPRLFYDRDYHLLHTLKLISQGKVFVELPKKPDGEDFTSIKKKSLNEKIFFTLSRYIFSLRQFVGFCSQFNLSLFPNDLKKEFFLVAKKDYGEIKPKIIESIGLAKKKGLNFGKKNNKDIQEIKELISIMEFYLAQVDLLMEFVDKDKEPNLIVSLAKLLFKFGEKENENLNKILKSLRTMILIEDNKSELLTALTLILSQVESRHFNNLDKIIEKVQKIFSSQFLKTFLAKKSEEDFYQKITDVALKEIGVYWNLKNKKKMPKWLGEVRDLLFSHLIYFMKS